MNSYFLLPPYTLWLAPASDVLLSPTIDLGDNNFASTANVHTLPLLSAADFCLQVQILGTDAIPNVDTPALGGSGA
jgi:hypothetical protein